MELSVCVPEAQNDINRAFCEKIERGIFDPVRRHIAGWWNEDDVWQDSLCQLFRDFRSAAIKGHPTDDGALVHGMRLRCFDISHRFTSGKGRRRDPMGRQAQYLDGVECLRFDGLVEAEDGPYGEPGVSHENPMSFVTELSMRQTVDIEDRLNSAFDLRSWIAEQTGTDQALLEARYAGCTLKEAGALVKCSQSHASRRLLDLGHDLAASSGLPVPRNA